MADYYSLLAKLLDGLPDATPQIRGGVYSRARKALAEQLKTVQPPLTEAEIEREGQALEAAITRLEERFEGAPALPAAAAPVPPKRSPLPPEDPEAEFRISAPEPEDRPEPIAAIRRGGRRQRPTALLLILVLLAIPVAVLAWLWRDQPPSPAPEPGKRDIAAAPAPPVEVKYAERVAGDPAQPARPPAARPPPQAAGPPVAPAAPAPANQSAPTATAPEAARPGSPAAGSAGGDVVIAQRALIFEENQVDPQRPLISAGRAIWRLDAVNSGQGVPLETVVRGHIDLPGAGLTLNLILRRNLDAALPASHTIELTFSTLPVAGSPARTVRDVALPLMRPEESIRGVAVAGLPVPVKENVFLIGLSDLRGDVERNTELLLKRNWMELPIRFASGQKAALLFDKGVSGERVFLDAFRQWGQAPP